MANADIPTEKPPAPPTRREEFVVRTRFVQPTLRRHIIARPRVDAIVARAMEYPLTVVKAEPGYGKTTAVASWLAGSEHAQVWYNVGETEADPHVFLLHLIQALRSVGGTIGTRALELLEQGDRAPRLWDSTVDALSNDLLDSLDRNTVLVLDDYDRVNSSEVNAIIGRLVESMPPRMHLVITARRMPSFRGRARWRASGEMLEVSRADLAFTSHEVAQLLERRLEQPLSQDVASAVAAETEGWPIALQMLSDSLGASPAEALDSLLQRIPGPSELLFDYLAEEVFLRQTADVRRFLGESALLRRLDADTCDRVLGTTDSAAVLRFLEDSSLFVSTHGSVRYHNLFRDFLMRRAGVTAERRTELHRTAAAHYLSRHDDEEAVHHLLAAGDHVRAADVVARIAAPMAASGRHQTLRGWLDQLPPAVLAESPDLLYALAETSRIGCRYAEAISAYVNARSRYRARGDRTGELAALRGHALCFLDTVQPARAEPLLREALRMTWGDKPARQQIYLLLAENRLNAGDLRRAERLFRAVQWATSRDRAPVLNPRVYVRTGRFTQARELIEAGLRSESDKDARARPPRSHREAAALLAWTNSMIGASDDARQHAAESLEIGQLLGSSVVECISQGRLGLSWLTGHDYDPVRAVSYFTDALRMAERIDVPRFKVEPLLGMTIVHGLEGAAEQAEATGREALAIVNETGDRYVRGVVCVALGAALTNVGRPAAEGWLLEAVRQGIECGDKFVQCVASLWLAIHYSRAGQSTAARQTFARALEQAHEHDYGFLFEGTALLAPKSLGVMRGLLRRAQEHPDEGPYARSLSALIDPSSSSAASTSGADTVATAALYIQTLGPFRVWRKGQEIERSAWGREKALHLLQLLVCRRERPLHREEILEALWKDGVSSTATTGLRVALSALRNALEPEREAGVDSPFVKRDGDTIRLGLELGVRVDADEFSRLLKAARAQEALNVDESIARYESALALYRGEFLGDNRYAEWAESERRERRREFIVAAERLTALLITAGEFERAIRWAETMLQHDPLWEPAYTVLMEAFWRQGNRALAVRTFNRCRKRLKDALGVAPSSSTIALLDRITQQSTN
ncbi:MAG: BTAD domain-containing putative transcriptional regulator [Gemmatimonadota bacterium]